MDMVRSLMGQAVDGERSFKSRPVDRERTFCNKCPLYSSFHQRPVIRIISLVTMATDYKHLRSGVVMVTLARGHICIS